MQTKEKGYKRSVRGALLCPLLLLIFVISALCLTSCFGSTVLDKDEILDRLNEDYPLDRSYACDYLGGFGIGGFNKQRFKAVETLYKTNYYLEELPGTLTLAKQTATVFLEYEYDRIDLKDEDALTASLINCYIYALGDKYGIYRLPDEYESYGEDMSGKFVGIGVSVTINALTDEILVNDVFEGSGAEAAGIKIGDKITAVNSVPISEIGAESAINLIKGDAGTTVEITVLRAGESLTLTATRAEVVETSVRYGINEENLAYIKISRFKGNTDEQFEAALDACVSAGAKGIIFDLRQNPGGYLDSVVNVIDRLVPKGARIASYKQRGQSEVVFFAEDHAKLSLPIVVLCDENTASAGELFTAAVRDYREMGLLTAKIVGSATYGKGVMQSSYPFLDGAALTFTVAYYNPPSNVNYEGVGITPDISVTGAEEQLLRAYEELRILVNNQN